MQKYEGVGQDKLINWNWTSRGRWWLNPKQNLEYKTRKQFECVDPPADLAPPSHETAMANFTQSKVFYGAKFKRGMQPDASFCDAYPVKWRWGEGETESGRYGRLRGNGQYTECFSKEFVERMSYAQFRYQTSWTSYVRIQMACLPLCVEWPFKSLLWLWRWKVSFNCLFLRIHQLHISNNCYKKATSLSSVDDKWQE
jgi:hypothetical protein